MSERGSFVTNYIYCERCFEKAKEILVQNDKYLKGVTIPHWDESEDELPIIAGKIGGLGPGDEFLQMEYEIKPLLNSVLCHKMTIAILPENGMNAIINCGPGEEERDENDKFRRLPSGMG